MTKYKGKHEIKCNLRGEILSQSIPENVLKIPM